MLQKELQDKLNEMSKELKQSIYISDWLPCRNQPGVLEAVIDVSVGIDNGEGEKATKEFVIQRIVDTFQHKIDLLTRKVPEEDIQGDNTMNFQNAVEAMKLGNKVRRLSWDEGVFIVDGVTNNHGIVAFDTTKTMLKVPIPQFWEARIEDLEATDWWVVV